MFLSIVDDWIINWGWEEDEGEIDVGSKIGIVLESGIGDMDTKELKPSDGDLEEFKIGDKGIDDIGIWEEGLSRELLFIGLLITKVITCKNVLKTSWRR